MKVAIVHDYLTQRGGAERVVAAMSRIFPDAEIHTSLFEPTTTFASISSGRVRTSALQRIPGLSSHPKLAFPALGEWFSRYTVDADVTLVSTSGWAHLVKTTGRKVVFTHTPARWLYRPDEYLQDARPLARTALTLFGPHLRRLDRVATHDASTVWLANSNFTAAEMRTHWGVEPEVLHPPAGIDVEGETDPVEGIGPGFALCVSRLLPYKNLDVVLRASPIGGYPTVIAGAGPLEQLLRDFAPPGTHVLGRVSDAQLRWLYANASCLVAVAAEDFGLTPIEANAFGKPVVALAERGYLDTVVDGRTGILISECTPDAVASAVQRTLRRDWDLPALIAHAERFGFSRFSDRLLEIVSEASP